MKKIYLGILIPIFVLLGFVFKSEFKNTAESIFYYSPCDVPIEYSIGMIDEGFTTSEEELISDSKIAGNIWNATQNRELFRYNPNSDFTINLVYDSRQKLTSEITEMNQNLKKNQEEIDPKIAEFKVKQQDFEKRIDRLNNEIQEWNSKGGAPKEEFDRLNAEQKALQQEARALNLEATVLGQKADEYNLNAKSLNKTIDNYQDVLIANPEEGLYEQDGANRKISIYIDVGNEEFLHTLAHEMGHALGLDHNNNSDSIMYPQTTSVLNPSNDEIEELSNICKERTVVEVVLNESKDIFEAIKSRVRKST